MLGFAEVELVGQVFGGAGLVQFLLVVTAIDGITGCAVSVVHLPIIIGPVKESVIGRLLLCEVQPGSITEKLKRADRGIHYVVG